MVKRDYLFPWTTCRKSRKRLLICFSTDRKENGLAYVPVNRCALISALIEWLRKLWRFTGVSWRRTGEQGNRGTGEQGNRGTGEQGNRGTGEQGNGGTGERGNRGTEEATATNLKLKFQVA